VTDLAPELLDWLDATLRPGIAWRRREARAWTRWPHRFRQRVEIGLPREHDGTMVNRVLATTPLVDGIVDPAPAMELVAAANRVASLSSAILDPEAGTVTLACAASVGLRNKAWLLPVLGEVLKLQVAVPEGAGPGTFAAGFGGRPDLVPHPDSGRRADPDPGLGVVDAYQRAGLAPGRLSARDYRVATGDLMGIGIPSIADGTRLDIGADTFNLGGAARIVLENATHPGFGNGLLVLLRIPTIPDDTDPAVLANTLNRRELVELVGGQSFGAWSVDDAGLGHVAFVPNLLLPRREADRRARVVNAVLDEVARLGWLDRAWPGLAPGG
jgi:hypothetical protein